MLGILKFWLPEDLKDKKFLLLKKFFLNLKALTLPIIFAAVIFL